MDRTGTLGILKQSIMLEKRGYAFYNKIAEQAADNDVKSFFESMAQEELGHIKILAVQFREYNDKKAFAAGSFDPAEGSDIAGSVLDGNIAGKIQAAGFEASAISAAIAFEQRSVDVYSEREENASDPEEKKLYSWLAKWEREHLRMLMEIDRKLLDDVWADNSFWPF